jgi:hypothetical protein
MLSIDRLIRILILLLVIVSGSLLGLSLGNAPLTIIAVVGAVLGFTLTDQLRLFRLAGLLANVASVIILILAMKDFFPEDSTGKLVSVAKLLVYLQTLLMFQEKTPRLNWQILVLSLLQVVVAAIFSMDIEGGLLFLLYFFVAGVTIVLQIIYSSHRETTLRNQQSARRVLRMTEEDHTDPVLFFNLPVTGAQAVKSMLVHLSVWMAITLAFAAVMFYMVPRHTSPWFGTNKIQVASTGFSKSVDLLNRKKIQQTNQLIFRAKFEQMRRDAKEVQLSMPPYFRGMALSSLVVENGRTNW